MWTVAGAIIGGAIGAIVFGNLMAHRKRKCFALKLQKFLDKLQKQNEELKKHWEEITRP